jgi:rhodanese-related sulfurtransferase
MIKPLFIVALIASALVTGYSLSKPNACGAFCGDIITSVSVSQFAKASENNNATVIDVRTAQEFSEGHIPNAVNADVNDPEAFERYLETLDKDNMYLVYCRSGNRSATAMQLMQDKGFTNIVNLSGGIQDWQKSGYALE